MPKIIEGNLIGKNLKFAIIVSRFNDFITNRLEKGCLDGLLRHSVLEEDISIFKVPGSFEMPLLALKTAESKKFDAVICLGAIIRGETPHFDFVAKECSKGIAEASLKTGVPVIFGVLTCETVEQAIDRAGVKDGNHGWKAALSALEMANVMKKVEKK